MEILLTSRLSALLSDVDQLKKAQALQAQKNPLAKRPHREMFPVEPRPYSSASASVARPTDDHAILNGISFSRDLNIFMN